MNTSDKKRNIFYIGPVTGAGKRTLILALGVLFFPLIFRATSPTKPGVWTNYYSASTYGGKPPLALEQGTHNFNIYSLNVLGFGFLLAQASATDNGIVNYILNAKCENQIMEIAKGVFVLTGPQRLTVSRPLMLDIGANAGFFTFYGLAMGYDVVSFEPQPGCVADIRVSNELNRAHGRLQIVNAPVSQTRFEVYIPSTGCNVGLQAASLTDTTSSTVSLLTTTIDEQIGTRSINFVKIDTEGHEIPVLESLLSSMTKSRSSPKGIVVEVLPPAWSAYGINIDRGLALLGRFADLGYELLLLDDPTPYPSFVEPQRTEAFPYTILAPLQKQQLPALIENRLQVNAGFNVLFLKIDQ